MANGEPLVPLTGSFRPPVPGAQQVGRADPNEVVTITLRIRRPKVSPGSIAVETGRTSLERREARARTRHSYGVARSITEQDLAEVRRFASEHDVEVVEVKSGQGSIVVRGTVSQLESMFNVELVQWRAGSTTFRGRTGQVHVPERLRDVITGVFGLDDRPQARYDATQNPAVNSNDLPDPHEPIKEGTPLGPMWPHQVAALYAFPSELAGRGENMAFIELGGGYRDEDLSTYFARLGLPQIPTVNFVGVDGGTNSPGQPADLEVCLDLEIAGAVAPEAKLTAYFAPNTTRGFLDAIAEAIHNEQHPCSVLCISWGFAEVHWTKQAVTAFEELLEDASALGTTILASAGDHGAGDAVGDGKAHVRYPASSPHVIACGGTMIRTIAQPPVEEAWNENNGWATGGGISDLFTVPVWQTETHIPPSLNEDRRQGRGVPDIAGFADQRYGYIIIADHDTGAVGGTSAVVPLYGALVARIKEGYVERLSELTPTLYNIARETAVEVFHDVRDGNNSVPATAKWGAATSGYASGPGWDACTGLGSVNGSALFQEILARRAQNRSVSTPDEGRVTDAGSPQTTT